MQTPSLKSQCRLPVLTLLLGLALFCSAFLSCRQKTNAEDNTAPAFNFEKTFSRDGAEVRLQMDRKRLNVAENGRLVVTATGPEQWPPAIAPPDSDPRGLSLTEIDRQGPTLVDAGRAQTRVVYKVQPFLPGEETIGAIQVRFARPDAELVLNTDPVAVTVVSLLPDKKAAALNDIAPPMAMASYLPLYLAAACLLLVLLLFLWWRFSKRFKKREEPPPAPPHLRAHQALDRLVASGYLEQGELILFFRKLSDILRRYIEERFSVRAPEQTTEEFLQTIAAMASFRAADKKLLQDFLTHCDLIKFARLEPTVREGRDRLQLCRRFIDETALANDDRGGAGGSS